MCAAEGIRFVPGHALSMEAIHGGKAKNDRIDAKKIAVLLRGGMLPQAYVYPPAMRATRDLLRRPRRYRARGEEGDSVNGGNHLAEWRLGPPRVHLQRRFVRGQQPIVRGRKPIVHGHRPTGYRHQAFVRGHHPVVSGHHPAVHGHLPVVHGHLPVVRGHHPVVHGHRPVGYGHPRIHSRPAVRRLHFTRKLTELLFSKRLGTLPS